MAHNPGRTKNDRQIAFTVLPVYARRPCQLPVSYTHLDVYKRQVSYRTGRDGRREFETSELIRAYGELKQN